MERGVMRPAMRDKGATLRDESVVLRMRPAIRITADQLLELSSLNRDLRLELTAEGDLIVMPPTGWETSDSNAEITTQLRLWAKRDGTGRASDSSGGFVLPNGAIRSPDAAWVANSRLSVLSAEQRKKYLPLCPDFATELRSPSDSLRATQEKMEEYIDNGARLGWLIDPERKRVYVYRPGAPVEELASPEKVSGEGVLPGFELDLREIW
jgi:Uma2 family endonuclease